MPFQQYNTVEYAIGIQEPPSVSYTEGFLDGPFAGSITYNSIDFDDADYEANDPPLRVFELTNKVEILPEGFAYMEGTINFIKVKQQFGITEDLYDISDIFFAIEYNYYE